MRVRLLIVGVIAQFVTSGVFGQVNQQLGYMPWHRSDSLKLAFLVIDRASDSTKTCNLHFLIEISGKAFTKKHRQLAKSYLNWCVKNYMLNDSWIDTAYGTVAQIQFMQVEFDLAEMYARKLRKALYENGHATNKFVRTTQKALLAACKEEFKRFEHETAGGKNKEVLERWRSYISINLENLAAYESSERASPTSGQ
jgi:hypothetical protein